MKFILIDAVNREVREIDIPNTLDAIYEALGVEMIEAVYPEGMTDCIYVDEEGALKNPKDFFSIRGGHQPFAGNGLVVGTDGNGETVATSYTAEEIKEMVVFMNEFNTRIQTILKGW